MDATYVQYLSSYGTAVRVVVAGGSFVSLLTVSQGLSHESVRLFVLSLFHGRLNGLPIQEYEGTLVASHGGVMPGVAIGEVVLSL